MNTANTIALGFIAGFIMYIYSILTTFGHVQPFCHEGVQYLETYHGISVQVDKFGRVVTCH